MGNASKFPTASATKDMVIVTTAAYGREFGVSNYSMEFVFLQNGKIAERKVMNMSTSIGQVFHGVKIQSFSIGSGAGILSATENCKLASDNGWVDVPAGGTLLNFGYTWHNIIFVEPR